MGLWIFRYVATLLLFGLGFLAPGIPTTTPLINANSDQEVRILLLIFFKFYYYFFYQNY